MPSPAPTTTSASLSRRVVMVSVRHPEELDEGMAEGLLAEGRRRGWSLLDLNLTKGLLADQPKPAGAIVTWLPSDPICEDLRRAGVPTVRLGRRDHPDDGPIPAVMADHHAAGRMAAEHFAARGFRHVACAFHRDYQLMVMTYEGFAARAAALGCTMHLHTFGAPDDDQPVLLSPAERYERRMRDLAAWVEKLPTPVGLLLGDDAMAAQVCMMCQRAGRAVPEQVAILGRGNREVWCEMAPVPLSSIDLNRVELVRIAAQKLEDMMTGRPKPPARTRVPPRRIITRRSTDILAANDPLVVGAVRYIWDHLDRDLSVEEVADAMQTPLRVLQRAFARHLGRGIKAELMRARLERFCELLRDTDLPVGELAPQVGFRTAQYLHNSFRKAYGMTPRAYRMQSTDSRE